MIKGAIFDMDGLLFDTERMYRDMWVILAKEYGLVPDPAFPKAVCGSSGSHMLEIIRHYYPEVDAASFAGDCLDRVNRQLAKSVPCKPGLHEILNTVRNNKLRTAIASSSQMPTILNNLKHAGITTYFDAIVSGADIPAGKPAPDIFLISSEKLGLRPEECYVFEDSTNGIHASAAAGCHTIMIPDLTEPTEELRSLCEGIYPTLNEAAQALFRPSNNHIQP